MLIVKDQYSHLVYTKWCAFRFIKRASGLKYFNICVKLPPSQKLRTSEGAVSHNVLYHGGRIRWLYTINSFPLLITKVVLKAVGTIGNYSK